MRFYKVNAALAAILSTAICNCVVAAGKHPTNERDQASEEALSLPSGAALFAELDSTLDTKKVKSGDPVNAHTTREIKYDGKVILPRNTKLVGHVTQASAKSKGDPESTLAIQFDKALPKKRPEVILNVVLRAIAAPERYASSGGPAEGTNSVGTAGSQSSPMGTPPRSPMPGGNSTPTMPGGSPRPGNDSGVQGAGTDSFGEASRGVVGIDGLQLASGDGPSAEKGALLVGTGKSVRLDGGTRLLFSVQ